ncbi:MAG: hypothetical protein ACLVJO_02675 [[Clostridium] scindens]
MTRKKAFRTSDEGYLAGCSSCLESCINSGVPIFLSFLVEERGLGTAADSGLGLAFFDRRRDHGLLYGVWLGFWKCSVAIGCLMLAVSYFIMAFAGSMILCHIGSLILEWQYP